METTITIERPVMQYDEAEDTYVETDETVEIEVTVTGSVSGKYRPATRWDPAEYGEVEIECAVDNEGNEIELTDSERAEAEEKLAEDAREEQEEGEDPDDARDRQMDREYDRAHGYDD